MEMIYINATRVKTEYVETLYTFEEVAKPQTEDYDIKVNYTHGHNDCGLMKIKDLRNLLQDVSDDIASGDITHIDIAFNEDHGEYEIAFFKLAVGVEPEQDPTDAILDRRIAELENELKELKNKKIIIENDDDLPF